MARVLIVDDEKSIRLTLMEFLKSAGHEVAIAEDATKASELLQSLNFDVVVSDIVLPRVSGVELLGAIKRSSPRVQVVIMTGEPTVETASEAVRAGAFDYLCKPVTKDAVLLAVANAAKIKALDDERERLAVLNREYQDKLEQLVDERTRDLSKALEELKRAEQQMIQQERLSALGQMASGIAHDFNNALMPIVGLSEFLLSHENAMDDREEATDILGAIHSAAEDAAQIVKRLREFYNPDESLFVAPLRLDKLIGSVKTATQPRWMIQAQAEGRPIEFETSVMPVPGFMANESQLREALANLIINAVDAMPAGGKIKIGAAPAADDMVEVRVSDTGEGMAEEVKSRCFEPFFTTKGQRGTGLGLSMVHGIVTRHGGTVEIESQVHGGTTVVLRLPVKAQNATEGNLTAEEEFIPAARLRVLVVDDEKWSRYLLAKYLGDDGHTVETAEGGREGIEKFRAANSDLVITDRAMPRVGGDCVAREIKKIAPATPVIMLTGLGDIMTLRQENPEGVDRIVGKPATQHELRKAIWAVMRKKSAAGRPS